MMKNNNFISGRVSYLIFLTLIALAGCSGGNESVSSSDKISGIAQLGYISNGQVRLIELSAEMKEVGLTSTSSAENDIGSFIFEGIKLNANKFYLIEVSGGQDVDSDDDGYIYNTPSVSLNSSVHAIFRANDIDDNNLIRVNALTDIIYQGVKSRLLDSELGSLLDQEAAAIIDSDIDGDSTVSHADLLSFDPVIHADKTLVPYYQILNGYVHALHEGNILDSLKALIDIHDSKILIDGNGIHEAPFNLSATITNLDSGVEVSWKLNGEQIIPTEYTVNDVGVYQLSAEILYENQRVAILDKGFVVNASEIHSATIAEPSTTSSLFIDDSMSQKLGGVSVTIPDGAVSESVEITASSLEIEASPEIEGVLIGPILSMEPSGTVFEKPVEIKLPYITDIDPSLIMVARQSADGSIDYITPLSVDDQNKIITFETGHFTTFTATNMFVGNTKDYQQVISDVAGITGHTTFTNEKWEQILNFEYFNEQSLYDLYLSWRLGKDVYDIENPREGMPIYNYPHISMYKRVYDNDFRKEIANQIDAAFDMADDALSPLSDVSNLTGVLNGDFTSLMGIPSPLSVATDVTKYAIKAAMTGLISAVDEVQLDLQIDKYFGLRNRGIEAKVIHDCLADFDGCNDDDVSVSIISAGWFSGGSAGIVSSSTSELWLQIEALYLIYKSYEDYEDDEKNGGVTSSKTLAKIINSVIDHIEETNAPPRPAISIDLAGFGTAEYYTSDQVKAGINFRLINIPHESNLNLQFKLYEEGVRYGSDEPLPLCSNIVVDDSRIYTCSMPFVLPEIEGEYHYTFEIINNNVIYGAAASESLKIKVSSQEVVDPVSTPPLASLAGLWTYDPVNPHFGGISADGQLTDYVSNFVTGCYYSRLTGFLTHIADDKYLITSSSGGNQEVTISVDSTGSTLTISSVDIYDEDGDGNTTELLVETSTAVTDITVASMSICTDTPATDPFESGIFFDSSPSVSVNFINEGIGYNVPVNAAIRIVPDFNMIEGNYEGVNCKLMGSANDPTIGVVADTGCYAGSQQVIDAVTSYSGTFQIVVYGDDNGDLQWEPGESSYCGSELSSWGEWSDLTCGSLAPPPPTTSINYLHINTFTYSEVNEGSGGVAVFVVNLDYPIDVNLSVDYCTYDISAFSGEDYVKSCGSVIFYPGDDQKQIQISLIEDSIPEPSETFGITINGVTISNPTSYTGTIGSGNSTAQVTILDDD